MQKEQAMSDNLRRYRAIRDALIQYYPGEPTGTVARHLTTLAALISGMVASKSTQLPKIATHVPDGRKPESRVKRFARWLRNDHITDAVYFVPYVELLLRHLAVQTLVFVIDGSIVGRGCVALMLHVVYKGRALPLAWQVRQGAKGHFPEDLHIALIKRVHDLIPPGASVVLLGDGEFDGTRLQHTVQEYCWSYVVRTGSTVTVVWDGAHFRCDTVGACIKPGTLVALPEVRMTEAAYGPVMLLCCWAKGYKEPLYLITNMASADEACRLYGKRFRIETFFSDQKSRGFHLHKSHLAEPMRLSRLLMAACLAYIWIVYLGTIGEKDGWLSIIHRGDRCDLSLFQLGLRLLDYLLNEGVEIPVAFYISI
jgi:Transposase DDE domain